jgi:division protein CdvB (Snf7/Vps24/ESCRT-III family)
MEADEVVDKILAEIGIDISTQLANTPKETAEVQPEAPQKQKEMLGEGGIDADLQARLNNLRNG